LLLLIYYVFGYIVTYAVFVIITNFMLKYKWKRMALGFIVSFVYFCGTSILIQLATEPGNPLFMIVQVINMLIIIFVMYSGTWKRKLLAFICAYGILGFSEITAYLIGVEMAKIKFNLYSQNAIELAFHNIHEDNLFHEFLINIGHLFPWIIMSIAYIIWRKFINRNWINVNWLLLIVPVYQIVLLFALLIFTDNITEFEVYVSFILVVFGILINITIAYLIHGMYRKASIENELSSLNRKRQVELKYYELASHNVEQMRAVRHDFGNQLQVIYQMLSDGVAQDEVKNLLDESYKNLRAQTLIRYCDNQIVNAVLVTKIASANLLNIKVECETSIPEELGITQLDLCSIFGNLLDNAIEACEKMTDFSKEDSRSRFIHVKSGILGGYLAVKVRNTFANPPLIKNGQIVTNKKDKTKHGLGLKLVEQIAKKYEGVMDIKVDEDMFEVVLKVKAY